MCQKLRYICQIGKFSNFLLTLRLFGFRCFVAEQLPFNSSGDWTEVFLIDWRVVNRSFC